MLAAQVTRLDGPRAVEVVERVDPVAGRNDVLIDVRCASPTFPDLLMTRGAYQLRPELPFVPGHELSGVVRSAPAASGLRPGQRVAALSGVGAFAECAAVAAHRVFALPDEVPFDVAAASPMNCLTMHFGLFRRGRVARGERVLVHGAAGGIGTAALQLLAAAGARPIAVVSSEQKAAVARAAGAEEVVDVEDFRAAVEELTDGTGVEVVVDPVGGDRFPDSLRCLAPEGRLLVLGFAGGSIPTVQVNRLLLRNVDVIGVGWGPFWHARPEYLQEQWREIAPMLACGALRPAVSGEFPLAEVPEVLAAMEERTLVGKAVLRIST